MTVSLVRYQPFTRMASLRQAMDRVFDERFFVPYRFFTFRSDEAAPIDVYHTEKEVVVKAALPGLKPEEIDISISDGCLNIKGETRAEERMEREGYLYQEHRYGTFHRSVLLPSGLKTDEAEASFEGGILTVTIPKSAKAKPRQIKVKAKAKAKAVRGKT